MRRRPPAGPGDPESGEPSVDGEGERAAPIEDEAVGPLPKGLLAPGSAPSAHARRGHVSSRVWKLTAAAGITGIAFVYTVQSLLAPSTNPRAWLASRSTDTGWWYGPAAALATSGTDQLKLIVAASQARRPEARYRFACFVTLFTWLTSASYHWCSTIGGGTQLLTVDETAWHILDNVGSIVWASLMAVELGAWGMCDSEGSDRGDDGGIVVKPTPAARATQPPLAPPDVGGGTFGDTEASRDALQYGVLAVAMVCQQKAPWDIEYTVGPIVVVAVLSIVRQALRMVRARQHRDESASPGGVAGPAADRGALAAAAVAGLVGLVGFAKGLDDDGDFLRLWHGLWHVFNAQATYWVYKTYATPGA